VPEFPDINAVLCRKKLTPKHTAPWLLEESGTIIVLKPYRPILLSIDVNVWSNKRFNQGPWNPMSLMTIRRVVPNVSTITGTAGYVTAAAESKATDAILHIAVSPTICTWLAESVGRPRLVL
jgi:hypothetical protein